jgi:hypothetical protein
MELSHAHIAKCIVMVSLRVEYWDGPLAEIWRI